MTRNPIKPAVSCSLSLYLEVKNAWFLSPCLPSTSVDALDQAHCWKINNTCFAQAVDIISPSISDLFLKKKKDYGGLVSGLLFTSRKCLGWYWFLCWKSCRKVAARPSCFCPYLVVHHQRKMVNFPMPCSKRFSCRTPLSLCLRNSK